MIRHLAAAAAALLNLIPSSIEQEAARRSLVWFEEENESFDPPTKPLPVCCCDSEPMYVTAYGTTVGDALCECGHWLHPGGVCGCGCNNVRLPKKAPASASATRNAVRGTPPVTCPPTSREADLTWIEYVTPAIQDVLAEHRIAYVGDAICCFSAGEADLAHGGFWDLQDWREHVAPLIAERLEGVTLALPENEAPQYIKPLADGGAL